MLSGRPKRVKRLGGAWQRGEPADDVADGQSFLCHGSPDAELERSRFKRRRAHFGSNQKQAPTALSDLELVASVVHERLLQVEQKRRHRAGGGGGGAA